MAGCIASVFSPFPCFSVVLAGGFFLKKQVSLFGDMKHVRELAALIPSVPFHWGFISNKFSQFAFKDTSCQLQPCCRPLVFVSEFRRNGSHSDSAPAVNPGFCFCSCPQRSWLMLSGTWHQGCESSGFFRTNSSSLSCSSSRSSQVFVIQAHDPAVETGTLGASVPHTQYMEACMIYDISISSWKLQPDAFSIAWADRAQQLWSGWRYVCCRADSSDGHFSDYKRRKMCVRSCRRRCPLVSVSSLM